MSTRGSTIVLFVTLAAGIGCEEAPPTEIPTVELAVIADGEHGGTPFKTRMTQEVTREPQYEGDPHGRGVARLTINVGQREVCWNISAENIVLPATAAHIHRAPAGVRGGIVVFLSPPQTNGRARGCASDLDRDLLRDILQNSANYYVNVHTTNFPQGAIRGQLDY